MDIVTYHGHHIVPKHAGGTDDPSNLVRLTVPAHAEAHRLLYEQYGRIGDRIAWLGLSGCHEEMDAVLLELCRQGGRMSKGRKHTPETKAKISAANSGRPRPDLIAINKLGLSKGKTRNYPAHRKPGNPGFRGHTHSPETLAKMRVAWDRRRAA